MIINHGTFVINFQEDKSIRTHWIDLCVNGDNADYFDSFRIDHISKEIKDVIKTKILQQMII